MFQFQLSRLFDNGFIRCFTLAGHWRFVEEQKSTFTSTSASATFLQNKSSASKSGLGNNLAFTGGGCAENSAIEGLSKN
jgi:hypothetical protein